MTLSRLLRTATTNLSPTFRGIKLRLVITVMAAVGLVADRSTAAVFNYLGTPVDVSPAAGGWETVDASTYGEL